MAKGYSIASIFMIVVTVVWFVFALSSSEIIKWHFLTAAAINFLMAMVINRQFTSKRYNYLGIAHVVLMVGLGFYGYFFI
jgi:hypothetical protein